MRKLIKNKLVQMFKHRYIAALIIIATLVIISQIIMQFTIIQGENNSRKINIAGRQSMLSQSINKAAFGLYFSETERDKYRYKIELSQDIDLWENSYIGLLNGSEELGLDVNNSTKIKSMFDDIDEEYNTILKSAKLLVGLPNSNENDKEKIREEIKIIQDNEQTFLKGMDAIVFQYDSESKENLKTIQITEVIILIVTLGALIIEAIFIFRPAQKQLEKSLKELSISKENLEKLFDSSPYAMMLINPDGLNVEKLNTVAESIIKETINDTKELNLRDLFQKKEEDQKLLDMLLVKDKLKNIEMVLKDIHDLNFVLKLDSNKIQYDGKSMILLGLSDITRLKEAEEVLKKYATVDEMTGILNKRSGMLIMENVFERNKYNNTNFSIIFIDLNDLKSVNDNYGHQEGDYFIKTIANIIKNSVGSSDTVFRYGGDEIVLVLDNCDLKISELVIKRINKNLKLISEKVVKPYAMTLSYGIAVTQKENVQSSTELMEIADKRMYEYKRLFKENRDK
ncbi:MAG: diguanylate cyclase [Firmicutes bacterium]|nr:diguanylate cyclase [Bacillota bacterium]